MTQYRKCWGPGAMYTNAFFAQNHTLVRVPAERRTTPMDIAYAWIWAPEFGGRNGFPPPEKHELVLSIKIGCADTVPFQSKPNTPF